MNKLVFRAYNTFKINTKTNEITKSSMTERLADEAQYYRSLPSDLVCYFPKFINYYKYNDIHNLIIEFYNYKNLGQVILEEEITIKQAERLVDRLNYILQSFAKFRSKTGRETDFRYKMFITKTEDEFDKLCKSKDFFYQLASKEYIKINNIVYKNFDLIWTEIKKIIQDLCVTDVPFNIIHGDLCFANILYSKLEDDCVIKLIDPRGSFGSAGLYGDPVYDLAKLYHSIEGGYEYIINDTFRCEIKNDNEFLITLFWGPNMLQLQNVFAPMFRSANLLKIKLITGTIFVGMCARHFDSFDRQLVMYLTGIRLLNEVLWQK